VAIHVAKRVLRFATFATYQPRDIYLK
jgi:hypothetical protein